MWEQRSNDYMLLQAKMEVKVQQTIVQVNTIGQRIEDLQRKLEQMRKMMFLTAWEAIEFALIPSQVSLQQLGKEMTDLTKARIGMQTKIQQLA